MEQMAQEAPPNEGAAPQQEGGDPMQAITALGESLGGLMQAMQESGAPEQVIAPLAQATEAYGAFMQALQGQGQAPAQAGTSDMNQAAGSKPAGF